MSEKIYKTKLSEDVAKRFRMLCEYSFNITEDDGEQMDMEVPDSGEEQGAEMQEPMGGEQQPMGGGASEGGAEMQEPMGGGAPEGGTEMQEPMGDEQQPMGGGAPGFNPQGGESEDMSNLDDDFGGETEPMQSDDEVIDVDELTSSQEKTEKKVGKLKNSMEKGFHKLLSVVDRLDKMIDDNTANMESIKREIEKRNPTPLEKLNMRAANDSYPFNISPSEYWKEKEQNSNYRIGGEDEPDSEQYTITQDDIDSMTDFKQISKELDSDEFNQNLMNIFGLK